MIKTVKEISHNRNGILNDKNTEKLKRHCEVCQKFFILYRGCRLRCRACNEKDLEVNLVIDNNIINPEYGRVTSGVKNAR